MVITLLSAPVELMYNWTYNWTYDSMYDWTYDSTYDSMYDPTVFRYACGLLPTDAAILTLNVPNADEVESALQGHLRGTLTRSGAASTASADTRPPHIPKCLIVDGKTLSHIFSGNLSKSFLRLADSCLAVLCCRTTPSQKAQVRTPCFVNTFMVVVTP